MTLGGDFRKIIKNQKSEKYFSKEEKNISEVYFSTNEDAPETTAISDPGGSASLQRIPGIWRLPKPEEC